MLAFLAHHGIEANPHDTGLQLHDQIMKEIGDRTMSRIQTRAGRKTRAQNLCPDARGADQNG
jgi:hypothetical protein